MGSHTSHELENTSTMGAERLGNDPQLAWLGNLDHVPGSNQRAEGLPAWTPAAAQLSETPGAVAKPSLTLKNLTCCDHGYLTSILRYPSTPPSR